MKSQIVPFEISVNLKEIGYDDPTWFVYPNIHDENTNHEPIKWNSTFDETFKNSFNTYTASAPIWGQVFEWFRENGFYNYIIDSLNGYEIVISNSYLFYQDKLHENATYLQAQIKCVNDLIHYYKKQKS
jgi:hypothetical protein